MPKLIASNEQFVTALQRVVGEDVLGVEDRVVGHAEAGIEVLLEGLLTAFTIGDELDNDVRAACP